MARSRPHARCTLAACAEHLDVYVWSGDQILFERRSSGGTVQRVAYTHGPGIDAPVSAWHSGLGTVVLHANRGGLIDMARLPNGTRLAPEAYTWAGLQSPLYPRYNLYTKGTGWLGSLVSNKQDESGLVYHAEPLPESADGPVHPGRPHRAGGRTQPVWVREWRSDQL